MRANLHHLHARTIKSTGYTQTEASHAAKYLRHVLDNPTEVRNSLDYLQTRNLPPLPACHIQARQVTVNSATSQAIPVLFPRPIHPFLDLDLYYPSHRTDLSLGKCTVSGASAHHYSLFILQQHGYSHLTCSSVYNGSQQSLASVIILSSKPHQLVSPTDGDHALISKSCMNLFADMGRC